MLLQISSNILIMGVIAIALSSASIVISLTSAAKRKKAQQNQDGQAGVEE